MCALPDMRYGNNLVKLKGHIVTAAAIATSNGSERVKKSSAHVELLNLH